MVNSPNELHSIDSGPLVLTIWVLHGVFSKTMLHTTHMLSPHPILHTHYLQRRYYKEISAATEHSLCEKKIVETTAFFRMTIVVIKFWPCQGVDGLLVVPREKHPNTQIPSQTSRKVSNQSSFNLQINYLITPFPLMLVLLLALSFHAHLPIVALSNWSARSCTEARGMSYLVAAFATVRVVGQGVVTNSLTFDLAICTLGLAFASLASLSVFALHRVLAYFSEVARERERERLLTSFLQRPQFLGSVCRFLHTPLQSVWP